MSQARDDNAQLRANDWVEVRSKAEILGMLDERGRLDEMPFMPEMLEYCGKRFRVSKRAHKTCDPVNGLESRRLESAVHLADLRCDGSFHDGCQAGCLFFWKEAWLKPVDGPAASAGDGTTAVPPGGACTEAELLEHTKSSHDPADPTYSCQATQVAAATRPLKWWDISQYVEDYSSGNVTILQMVSALVFTLYHTVSNMGLGLGAPLRWAYDTVLQLFGGAAYPWRLGRVPKGTRTPSAQTGIAEGELVRIKTYDEILETLDEEWKNRGLYFDGEMVPYTTGTFRVLKRVQRIIHEKTGKMLRFKNEALILDNVVCQARYAKCRKLCPRGYYLYWREIWLERAGAGPAATPACDPGNELDEPLSGATRQHAQ